MNNVLRVLAGLGAAAMLGVFTQAEAISQGISAKATVVKQDPSAEINQLRKQLAALELRVKELEKQKVELSKEDEPGPSEARVKKIEQRVASLEQAFENPSGSTNTGTGIKSNQTVHAPFSVVNESGKILFRVDTGEGARPRAVVGDPTGPHVHLGLNAAGGASVIAAYAAGEAGAGAYLVSSPANSVVVAKNGKTAARLDADKIGGKVSVNNASDIPVALIASGKLGNGGFMLVDSNGDIRVQAGVTAELIGEVPTSGPGGGGMSTAPGLPSSIIRGWKNKH